MSGELTVLADAMRHRAHKALCAGESVVQVPREDLIRLCQLAVEAAEDSWEIGDED